MSAPLTHALEQLSQCARPAAHSPAGLMACIGHCAFSYEYLALQPLVEQGVWFNAHRPCDGTWLPAHQLERTAEGRFIAYVARHGHGTYPCVGPAPVLAPGLGFCMPVGILCRPGRAVSRSRAFAF